MSSENKKVVAICCADIHLSMKAPPARAREKDWFEAMQRTLKEIDSIAKTFDCPILCAGDVFDHWNAPAELINFAIRYLPKMFAIPGQHDLPFHSNKDIFKSAFWTLVQAGTIKPVTFSGRRLADDPKTDVYGFGWGEKIYEPNHNNALNIALVHDYVWYNESYVNAPTSKFAQTMGFENHDTIIIGDNHQPWDFVKKKGSHHQTIYNCGSLMRRKSDDKHRPSVGLILSDGTVNRAFLTSANQDVFDATAKDEEVWDSSELRDFLKELRSIQTMSLDFHEAVTQTIEKMNASIDVKQILMKAMEA